MTRRAVLGRFSSVLTVSRYTAALGQSRRKSQPPHFMRSGLATNSSARIPSATLTIVCRSSSSRSWGLSTVTRSLVTVDKPQERLDERSEEHTSELQSRSDLVCRLLLEKKKNTSS